LLPIKIIINTSTTLLVEQRVMALVGGLLVERVGSSSGKFLVGHANPSIVTLLGSESSESGKDDGTNDNSGEGTGG